MCKDHSRLGNGGLIIALFIHLFIHEQRSYGRTRYLGGMIEVGISEFANQEMIMGTNIC